MALLDLLGRRWALRILWELRERPLQFRPLQERCEGMSSSVLAARLRELREAGILEAGSGGYRLTGEGEGLLAAFPPLLGWSVRGAQRSAAGASPPRPQRSAGSGGSPASGESTGPAG